MAIRSESCPCGSAKDYAACCGPYHRGETLPPTAELTMRSRYAAFALGDADYLASTIAPGFDTDFDPEEVRKTAEAASWKGLDIRKVDGGAEGEDEGWVEFVARFNLHGRPIVHHERSRFVRGGEDNRWLCADSEMNPKEAPRTAAKVGRNDPCPCGSGKKYKKCCGA